MFLCCDKQLIYYTKFFVFIFIFLINLLLTIKHVVKAMFCDLKTFNFDLDNVNG